MIEQTDNNCSELRSDLAEVKTLAEEFLAIREEALAKRNMHPALIKLNELEERLNRLKNEVQPEWVRQEKLAREVMGSREVLGPAEVEKAYGIKLNAKEIPSISFSADDLKRAKELGQFLVLRVSKDAEGRPLTMKRVRQALLDHGYDESKNGSITAGDYGNEPYWVDDPIELKWALTSKEIIPDSTDKNYLEQTKQLARYLKNEVFKGTAMPIKYKDAIDEFKKYCNKNFKGKTALEIEVLIDGLDWRRYAEEISELSINQLTRQTPAEILYDIFIYNQNNSERILDKMYVSSKRRSIDGRLVRFGWADSVGAAANGHVPSYKSRGVGVVLSRSSV